MKLGLSETRDLSVHPFPSPRPSGREPAPSRPEGRDPVELVLAAGLIAAVAVQALLLIAGWIAG